MQTSIKLSLSNSVANKHPERQDPLTAQRLQIQDY